MVRGGFSIVELIFSIVIIGIAAATMPIIVSSANSLDADTQNQDIYYKSATVMTDVISKFWGKGMDANQTAQYYILGVAAGDSYLAAPYRDISGLNASKLDKNVSEITKDSMGLNSIDDYNGRFIDETDKDSNIRSDITVVYVPDTTKKRPNKNSEEYCDWNLTGQTFFTSEKDSTNLKRITIVTKRKSGDTVFESFLTYFASNIGSAN